MNEHIWTAIGTNIEIRWRMAGWVPPSEMQEYRNKWKYYQNLPMRHLDDAAKEQYEHVMRKAKIARIR